MIRILTGSQGEIESEAGCLYGVGLCVTACFVNSSEVLLCAHVDC